METYFAPPERTPLEVIRESSVRVANDQITSAMLKGFDGSVMILNEHRQILAVNTNLLEMLQLENQDDLLGLRPGEAINCVHSTDCINGCGTGSNCRFCGVVKCLLKVLMTNMASEGECLMNLGPGGTISMEFSIGAFPIYIYGERLIVVRLRDITPVKFIEAIEQYFLHDIMNTINCLLLYTDLFDCSQPSEYPELAKNIKLLSTSLASEVNFQRTLRRAKTEEYNISLQEVSMAKIASEFNHYYGEYWKMKGKFLEVIPVSEKLIVKSDPILINRIITNMVKNAMEAIQQGDKVKVSCRSMNGSVVWEVWNTGVIPEDIAPRIFQSVFSTKGSQDRGWGTSSMKLFGEYYLGGKVGFITSEEDGTVFSFTLPKTPVSYNC